MDAHPDQTAITAPSLHPIDLPSTVVMTGSEGMTLRELYMEDILKRFPNFKPRGDVDIWLLGAGSLYRGTEEGIYAWVDKELATYVSSMGSEERVQKVASDFLSPIAEVTGRKPKSGVENPLVLIRPIPNSEYSMRLFPGAFASREYCLDFVKSDTGEPINSPFEFELWAVPGAPRNMRFSMRLRSLEESFGVRPENVTEGAETFVLRDGMPCLLKRPGNPTIQFTVPVRVKEAAQA